MMKTIAIALALVAAMSFTPASAKNLSPEAAAEFCSIAGVYAEAAMKFRQRRGDIAKDLEMMRGLTKNPDLLEFVTIIVHEAYKVPRYRSEANIEREVVDFKSKIYVWCVKGVNE